MLGDTSLQLPALLPRATTVPLSTHWGWGCSPVSQCSSPAQPVFSHWYSQSPQLIPSPAYPCWAPCQPHSPQGWVPHLHQHCTGLREHRAGLGSAWVAHTLPPAITPKVKDSGCHHGHPLNFAFMHMDLEERNPTRFEAC